MLRPGARLACAVFVAVLGGTVPAWAGAPRVAVLETTTMPEEGRGELRAQIAQALKDLGADVVPRAALRDLRPDCDTADCFIAVGRATAATHVLRVQGAYADEGYRLRLQLWDGATGKLLSSEGKDCEICTLSDLYRAARERTTVLCARAFDDAAASAPATPAPDRSPWKQPLSIGGAALVSVGLGLLAGGIYLIAVDGDPACGSSEPAPCVLFRDTAGRGRLLVAGGAAAVLGGGALLYLGRRRSLELALAVAPQRLVLVGRF